MTYMIFDLLYLDGHITLELPYRERRALLEQLELNGPAWQTPAYHVGDGRDALAATAEHGLEGVVAKRLDSPYRPGAAHRYWLKVKNVNRQELVIGGWLAGKGRRSGQLGALLDGLPRGRGRSERVLRYAGRVGTGFDEAELERLAQDSARVGRRSSPFSKLGVQPPRGARFVGRSWSRRSSSRIGRGERILRHSSYKGLR